MIKNFNDYYKMDHKSRGYAVIINNYEFDNVNYVSLKGHKFDVEKYKETFQILGFKKDEIKEYENLKAKEMIELMKEYASKDYTDCDCFISVFLSHGYLLQNKQYIMGTDQGAMFHEHLTDVFKETESLFKKPKIFWMDVCRGNETEPVYTKSTANTISKAIIHLENESTEDHSTLLMDLNINITVPKK